MTEHFYIATPTPTPTKLNGFRTYQDPETGRLMMWSAKFDLPKIGETVHITMNSIGAATVVGYFASPGNAAETEWYVGIMTRATNPPEWLRKQNQAGANRMDRPQWWRDGIGCEFGTEISY